MFTTLDHSVYGENGKYKWIYSDLNAEKILDCSPQSTHLYTLLCCTIFDEELNLHTLDSPLVTCHTIYNVENCRFTTSRLLKRQYFYTFKIPKWAFKHIILSAFFHVLKKAVQVVLVNLLSIVAKLCPSFGKQDL